MVQLDKLIRLLETPIFAYLRLQVRCYHLVDRVVENQYPIWFAYWISKFSVKLLTSTLHYWFHALCRFFHFIFYYHLSCGIISVFSSYLQLLEPERYIWLLKALYGLLMLLPQVCLAKYDLPVIYIFCWSCCILDATV